VTGNGMAMIYRFVLHRFTVFLTVLLRFFAYFSKNGFVTDDLASTVQLAKDAQIEPLD